MKQFPSAYIEASHPYYTVAKQVPDILNKIECCFVKSLQILICPPEGYGIYQEITLGSMAAGRSSSFST